MAGWLICEDVLEGINLFNRSKNSMNINRLSENVSKTQALEKKVLLCVGEC